MQNDSVEALAIWCQTEETISQMKDDFFRFTTSNPTQPLPSQPLLRRNLFTPPSVFSLEPEKRSTMASVSTQSLLHSIQDELAKLKGEVDMIEGKCKKDSDEDADTVVSLSEGDCGSMGSFEEFVHASLGEKSEARSLLPSQGVKSGDGKTSRLPAVPASQLCQSPSLRGISKISKLGSRKSSTRETGSPNAPDTPSQVADQTSPTDLVRRVEDESPRPTKVPRSCSPVLDSRIPRPPSRCPTPFDQPGNFGPVRVEGESRLPKAPKQISFSPRVAPSPQPPPPLAYAWSVASDGKSSWV
ncbi:hypothetical protein BSKO_07482 [Bryopsis sp. KO-2023]|nr:hypothetical protein BSKO_07482 [Bryopsis sp. KO-2023]